MAREKALANGLTVFEGTAESPPEELKERHFDLIIMSHVLEHCTDPMAAIEKRGICFVAMVS